MLGGTIQQAVLSESNPRRAAEGGAVRPSGGYHALARGVRYPGGLRRYCEAHATVDQALAVMRPAKGLLHVDVVNAQHAVNGGVYLTVGVE